MAAALDADVELMPIVAAAEGVVAIGDVVTWCAEKGKTLGTVTTRSLLSGDLTQNV